MTAYKITMELYADPEDVNTFGLWTGSPVLEDAVACGNYEVKLVQPKGEGEDP